MLYIHKDHEDKYRQIMNDVNAAFFFPDSIPKQAPPPAIDLNIPLLACPFCGSVDVKRGERVSYGHGDSTCQVYVECKSCRAKGPDTGYWGLPTDEERRKAIDLWNNRML